MNYYRFTLAFALSLLPGAALPAAEGLFAALDSNSDGVVEASEVTPDQSRLFDRLLRRGDADEDGGLSRQEFERALIPDTPPKPIEQQRADSYRGADQTRLLLLMLDTDRDRRITEQEVPTQLKSAFEQLLPDIDADKNGELSGRELTRGGPRLSRRAARIVRGLDVDVDVELKKLKRNQGADARRFDEPLEPMKALTNPNRTKALFAELDADGNGQIVLDELPTPLQERFQRVMRRGDRNRDGKLSQNEFLSVAKRLGRFLQRRNGGTPPSEKNPETPSSQRSKPSTP